MNSITGQELVSYNQSSGQLWIGDAPNNVADYQPMGWYPNYYDQWHYTYYPIFYPQVQFVTEKSKVEQAFKIITKLIEHKIIVKEITVKELIKMVNDIAEII